MNLTAISVSKNYDPGLTVKATVTPEFVSIRVVNSKSGALLDPEVKLHDQRTTLILRSVCNGRPVGSFTALEETMDCIARNHQYSMGWLLEQPEPVA